MRTRTFTLLAVLALVVAACSGSDAGDGATTTLSVAETTSTTTLPTPEAIQLSYALEPGASHEYEVEVDQTIDMSTSGDTSALGEAEGEDVPSEMSIQVNGTSVFTHAVAEGPEPGTFEITITGDFSDMEFDGTIDGEPVDPSEIPDMAEMDPVDVTIVVDEQGNVIPDDSGGLGDELFGGLGGLDMMDQLGAGGGTGRFIGPPFPDGEVTVGDTWSDTVEIPTMPGEDPVVTEIVSEVVGTDTIDDIETLVIETTNSTSAIEFDLAELLIGFMTAFVPEDMSEEEQAELDALVEDLRFAFMVDPQVMELTTWFDSDAGLARQAELSGDTHLVMDMNIPDETTGELVEFALDMNIDQHVTYRLIGSTSA